MSNLKIGIVTVLYNSETVLFDFFESLAKQTYQNFILYAIDNKSPDNSLDLSKNLAKQYSFQTEIIANDENYGVAKGNNIGIVKAMEDDCDYILLSNNDVTFESNCVELLLKSLQEKNADIAVPKIYFWGTNVLWFAGGKFCKFDGHFYHLGYAQEDDGKYNSPQSIIYAPTCFMMIKRSVFDKVGLMDEKYFVYWDDADFVFRAIQQNMTLWYFPEPVVQHKESISTGGGQSDFSIYYKWRNFVYFTRKNYSLLHTVYYLCFKLKSLFKNLLKLNFHQCKLMIKGYKAGFSV